MAGSVVAVTAAICRYHDAMACGGWGTLRKVRLHIVGTGVINYN
jgi:hypothetical protein